MYHSELHGVGIGGPMDGCVVSVTESDLQVLERDWGGGANWNICRADYERDVIG